MLRPYTDGTKVRGELHEWAMASLRKVGESSRSWATAAGTTLKAKSMSAEVVWRPRLKRRLARASSGGRPIAVRTWDGSTAPEEQAAPVEQARPFKSSAMRRASPSTPGMTRLVVLGVRGTAPPFTRDWGTRWSRPCCNFSRRLHGVGVEVNVGLFGDAADFFEWLDGAELVVGVHDGDKNGFRADGAP